ncbi:hypothetical protein COB55_02315 [Candidatus Wolfebacteria bacterium]|nr:MAG: hypothetical protein COB55_02315 [Candidatus Wolfebacteria bacterium]
MTTKKAEKRLRKRGAKKCVQIDTGEAPSTDLVTSYAIVAGAYIQHQIDRGKDLFAVKFGSEDQALLDREEIAVALRTT